MGEWPEAPRGLSVAEASLKPEIPQAPVGSRCPRRAPPAGLRIVTFRR
jgi:hypothetical protein